MIKNKQPIRIASLISAGTEMLFSLGLGDQIVGVSHDCDWPEACRHLPRVTRTAIDDKADSRRIDEQVRDHLAQGRPIYEVDAEKLAQLQPDLIVTQAQCEVCAIGYDDVLATVEAMPELRNAEVFSLNPRTLGDVLDDLRRLGSATGIAQRSDAKVAELERRIDVCRGKSLRSVRPRVAMIEWIEPIMLAGNWVPELLELAGGRCDLTSPGKPSRYHTWDEIRQFDPQLVVICPCGFDAERAEREGKRLTELPGWNDLAAVRAGQVHYLDGNAHFNRPGPRLVDSLEWLGSTIERLPAYP